MRITTARGRIAACVLTAFGACGAAGHAAAQVSIPSTFEAEDFDLGGEGIGYHDNVPGNAGGLYRPDEDVDIIRSGDTGGGYDVNNFETGEWLAYTLEASGTGEYDIALRLASGFSRSRFHIEIDGRRVTGSIQVPNTGGWRSYEWIGVEGISLTAGQHRMQIVVDRDYFNLNAIRATATLDSEPYSGTPIALPGRFEAEDFDLGGEGLAYHDNVAGNAGGQYRLDEDVDIIASSDSAGIYDVNNFETGEWLAYTVDVAETADYDIGLRVASGFSDSAFRVEVDGVDVTGRIGVPHTGGWTRYRWVGASGVSLTAGRHRLRIISEQQYFNLNSARVAAAASTSEPVPEPEPTLTIDPDEVEFSCTFPSSPTDCGFYEQAKEPGRATIVAVARDGTTGVRLHTEPGDTNVSGSGDAERNDLMLSQSATGCYEGAEQWWSHSVLFPDDYVAPPDWGVAMDFHHTGSTGQANFHVDAASWGLRLRGYGGASVDSGRYEVLLAPVVKNHWYDFVYHVRWSSGSDGLMDAWVDGEHVLSHRGPTLYRGMGCYLKLANYHTSSGEPSSVIHDRVIRGATPEAVSVGALEDVLELVDGVLTPLLP